MLMRLLVPGLLALSLLLPGVARATHGWPEFKAAFITADGRVMDPGNNNISHSEGQGYAMLLAVAHDDAPAFALLWEWARNNLQMRGSDSLLAWSFGERLPGQWRIMDFNNATDGDVLVAFALLRAWEKWSEQRYRDAALRMVQDIRELLVVEQGGRLILLPGYYGFHGNGEIRHNPSYVVYPALDLFARYDDAPFWERLKADSLAILGQAMHGRPALPPDWVALQGGVVAQSYAGEAAEGFEGVRVILYLAWDNNLQALPGLGELVDRAAARESLPLIEGENASLAADALPGGFCAVLARAARDLGAQGPATELAAMGESSLAREDGDYYSHVLTLLSGLEFP